MKHQSHPEIVKRLRRAEGHLKSTLAMFDEGRGCLDLAQQLHAVEAAIASTKRELIHDHIAHCLQDGVNEGALDARTIVDELKALTKYL